MNFFTCIGIARVSKREQGGDRRFGGVNMTRKTKAAEVAIALQDELDAMLASQLLVVHTTAMDCYRRAANAANDAERLEHVNHAIKLSRAFAMLIEALVRHRVAPHKVARIVRLQAGGEAVGTLAGRAVQKNSAEQPHAPARAYAA